MIQTNHREPREADKESLLRIIGATGNKTTVIVGLSKNAGKTTFLNWLLEKAHYHRKGVITTGRDGEATDLIDNIKKPKVRIPPSSIFSVRPSEINKHPSFLKVLEKLPFKAGGQSLWLVKAEEGLETEIVGPPSVSEQIAVAKRILRHGAEHVFIDGSLDRKAIGSSSEVDSLVICGSAVSGSLAILHSEFRRYYDLTLLEAPGNNWQPELIEQIVSDPRLKLIYRPEQEEKEHDISYLECSTLLGHEKEIVSYLQKNKKEACLLYVPTSLAEKSFRILKSYLDKPHHLRIMIKHPFHLQLERSSFDFLMKNNSLITLRQLHIAGFIINSFALNGNHLDSELFRESLRKEFEIPVVDVMEVV